MYSRRHSNQQNILSRISRSHHEFSRKLLKSLSMDNQYYITVIPSLIFIISCMFIVRYLSHRRTFIPGNTWKQIAFREIIFQWGYYYTTRLWLYFIKIIKWIDSCTQSLIANNIAEEPIWLLALIHATFVLIHTCVSLIPLLLIINERYNRPVMPNFLIWIGTHRRERTEIGISAYYLDHPLRYQPLRLRYHNIIPTSKTIVPSYRARRSCSADHAEFLKQIEAYQLSLANAQNITTLRLVKSMEYLKPISLE